MIIEEFMKHHKEFFPKDIFQSCMDCGKPLTNPLAKSIGLGTKCQKRHKMNYTIIPYFEDCETLFDNLKEELNVNIIVTLNDVGEKIEVQWFVNNDEPPYDWRKIQNTEISSYEKYLIYAISIHEYIPHNLCQKGDKEDWDDVVILTCEAKLQMKKIDACAPQYESFTHYEEETAKVRIWCDYECIRDANEMVDLRSISVSDMLHGGKWSPYHIDYPHYSVFQKMYIERWCTGYNYPAWGWTAWMDEMGLEDYNEERGDSIFGYGSDDKDHDLHHERRMWESILECIIEHAVPHDPYCLPNSILKHTLARTWIELDWTSWMFTPCTAMYHTMHPVYNTKGEVVFAVDQWESNLYDIECQLHHYTDDDTIDGPFGEYIDETKENLNKLIILSLSNLHTTKTLTH